MDGRLAGRKDEKRRMQRRAAAFICDAAVTRCCIYSYTASVARPRKRARSLHVSRHRREKNRATERTGEKKKIALATVATRAFLLVWRSRLPLSPPRPPVPLYFPTSGHGGGGGSGTRRDIQEG